MDRTMIWMYLTVSRNACYLYAVKSLIKIALYSITMAIYNVKAK